jgi:hypothetical protein
MKEKLDNKVEFKAEGKVLNAINLLREKLLSLSIDFKDKEIIIKGDTISIK